MTNPTPARPFTVDPRRSAALVNLIGGLCALGLAALLARAFAQQHLAQAAVWLGLSGLLLVILTRPTLGLLTWVIFAPFYRFFVLEMGSGLPDLGLHRITALALVGLLLAQRLLGRRSLQHLTAVEGLAALYAGGMLLSVPASHMGLVMGVQNIFDFVLLPLLWFYLARNLLGDRPGIARLTAVIAVAGALMGLIALREQLTQLTVLSPVRFQQPYGAHSIKVNSLFGAPAIMSTTIALTVGLSFIGAARAKAWGSRLAFGLALAASLAGLIFTYVRSSWLMAGIILAAPILLDRRTRRFARYTVPLIALVVSITFINRGDTRALTERFQSQRPIDYRVEAMTVGIKLAARSPIFGLGLDNYGQAALEAGWRPAEGAAVLVANHPHNLFIYVLTSGGLVALLPLVALYALLLRRGLAWLPDPERRLWGGLVLGMTLGHSVAAASFDVYLAQLANMFYFMIMGALFGAFERKPAQATHGLEHTPEAGA